MKEKQLLKFIEKIIVANKANISNAQKELSELASKLSSDGVSSELVELTNDISLYLPYTDFNRRFLPFTKKYLKTQSEKGKICKQKLDEKETKNQTVIEQETSKGQNENIANPNDISKFKNLTGGYCLPSFVYERAAAVYEANGRTAEADAQATNIIKDAVRGCFR